MSPFLETPGLFLWAGLSTSPLIEGFCMFLVHICQVKCSMTQKPLHQHPLKALCLYSTIQHCTEMVIWALGSIHLSSYYHACTIKLSYFSSTLYWLGTTWQKCTAFVSGSTKLVMRPKCCSAVHLRWAYSSNWKGQICFLYSSTGVAGAVQNDCAGS